MLLSPGRAHGSDHEEGFGEILASHRVDEREELLRPPSRTESSRREPDVGVGAKDVGKLRRIWREAHGLLGRREGGPTLCGLRLCEIGEGDVAEMNVKSDELVPVGTRPACLSLNSFCQLSAVERPEEGRGTLKHPVDLEV